jgi:peroxiredoxin (alkyl hydroperoxide reductase subunit C)
MSTLVCQDAPNFTAAAVLANGTIEPNYTLLDAIKDKYGLVFFYPLDFTFVCPTELVALNNRIEEFKKRNVEVIAISIDSAYTHQAWRNTPVGKGGIGPVKYTMVADIKHDIARAYGVESDSGVALRGAFLINKKGKVCSVSINDLPIGRNVDELIRLVDALQFHETHGEVCPANWSRGAKGFHASQEGVSSYLAENETAL